MQSLKNLHTTLFKIVLFIRSPHLLYYVQHSPHKHIPDCWIYGGHLKQPSCWKVLLANHVLMNHLLTKWPRFISYTAALHCKRLLARHLGVTLDTTKGSQAHIQHLTESPNYQLHVVLCYWCRKMVVGTNHLEESLPLTILVETYGMP